MTRYRTIVADPPWHYDGFAKGRPGWRMGGAAVTTTALPYPSMSISDIAALPVADWSERDAWLFLWTTNRYIPESFSIAEGWGFAYRQLVVWDKGDCMPLGGCITTNRAEYLLVCRKGNPSLTSRWPGGSVIQAPKGTQSGEHSKKPEVFLDMVEAVAPGPYLELFSRRARLGWSTWGNESLEGGEAA